METNIENLEFKNDENLENQNEPKLLYKLDNRNPFYIAFDLVIYLSVAWIPIIFAIPNFVFDIGIFSLILNIFCAYISFIVLQILYSIIFFDYFEIYEDKMIYRDILGFNFILCKDSYKSIFSSNTGRILFEKIFINKKRISKLFEIFPFIVITSLSFDQRIELENKIFEMQISNFNKKDKK